MYLSKLQMYIFVKIPKCICQNYKMNLSTIWQSVCNSLMDGAREGGALKTKVARKEGHDFLASKFNVQNVTSMFNVQCHINAMEAMEVIFVPFLKSESVKQVTNCHF